MERTLSPEQIAAKKERREREGKVNMARYREQQQGTLDRMARLRAQRLARPEMSNRADRVNKAATTENSLPRRAIVGLHNGIRG